LIPIITGAIAYLYFAKKEITYQKEGIHSKRISEWAMTDLTDKLKRLKELKDDL